MASTHNLPPSLPASVTDCPQCGALCLGAITLPCGHLSCRKCCRQLNQLQRGSRLNCRSCRQHLPLPKGCSSVSQVIQQFGTDPVLDHLVRQRLQSEGPKHCLVHENSDATMVCEDCHDYFCDTCSRLHSKQTATTDHVLQLLPTAFRNAPFASCEPSNNPRTYATSSTDSDASISNPDDPPPSGQSAGTAGGKEWLQKEVKLMQQSVSERRSLLSSVKEIVSLGERILNRVEVQERLLQTNTDVLSACDVTKETDGQNYVVRRSIDDTEMTVNAKALDRRLAHVRNTCNLPSTTAVERIRTQLSDLLRNCESVGSTPCTVDVMTASPVKVFATTPASADDKKTPATSFIVCTQDEKLVMTDGDNNKVKVVDMSDPHTVSDSLTVTERTRRLALLSDGQVAMTTDKYIIYLLKMTPSLAVTSRVETGRYYVGLAEGPAKDTLLVGTGMTKKDPARVDIITRGGSVLRTVVDSTMLTKLAKPDYLCVLDSFVLVSDWMNDAVYKVDVITGRLVDTLTHTDMRSPNQVSVDGQANVYVACRDGHCVLVRSKHGQWKTLLGSAGRTDQSCDCPFGVCVTRSGRVVVAWRKVGSLTTIVGYDLKK